MEETHRTSRICFFRVNLFNCHTYTVTIPLYRGLSLLFFSILLNWIVLKVEPRLIKIKFRQNSIIQSIIV